MRPTGLLIAAATIPSVFATGCVGRAGDRAGGNGDVEPVVLTFAIPGEVPPPQIESWAQEVRSASNGNITIDFQNLWRAREPEFETGTLRDVQAEQIDMAQVGARVLDRLGVDSFQVLLAPMLVDSHDLQARVFEAEIPEQMLTDLSKLDLVGIAALPGPLRRVLGIDKPFLRPDDFEGQTVGYTDSDLARQALEAVGATPQTLPPGTISGVDAYEQQFASIVGNHYAADAGFLTANLNLWPRPLVIVMNEAAYERLTPRQRQILSDAGNAAIPNALEGSRAEDANAGPSLCRDLTVVVASDVELGDLREAFAPLYQQLRESPSAARDLDSIVDIKEQLGAPPDTLTCSDYSTAGTGVLTGSKLSGTYTWTLTDEDALEHGTSVDRSAEALVHWYPTTFTIVLNRGRWVLTQSVSSDTDGGSYEQFRDRIVFTWDAGLVLTFTYTTDDDGNVTLTPVEPMPDGDAFVWSTKPWIKSPD